MRILIWAFMFLALTMVSTTVGAAAIVGMPIAGELQFGVLAMTALLAGWGVVLLAASRHAGAQRRLAHVSARRSTDFIATQRKECSI
jgi:hypothetical protein